ncbi:MAG: hypothetical protein CM15mP120_03800 [Pseudomonadota bacterium]|nr:MAG: hypothetical protein CM15mP120_03800 [Pseudomonadota bacterium]
MLNNNGEVTATRFTDRFFDPNQDPLTEKATRLTGDWFFVTFHGAVHQVEASDAGVRVLPSWPLLDEQQLAGGWRPGGPHFWQVTTQVCCTSV